MRAILIASVVPALRLGSVDSSTKLFGVEVVEQTISETADYISMARPFIREPDLAKRWHQGDRSLARCISCNGCFMPGIKHGGIYCVVEKKEQEKKQGS